MGRRLPAPPSSCPQRDPSSRAAPHHQRLRRRRAPRTEGHGRSRRSGPARERGRFQDASPCHHHTREAGDPPAPPAPMGQGGAVWVRPARLRPRAPSRRQGVNPRRGEGQRPSRPSPQARTRPPSARPQGPQPTASPTPPPHAAALAPPRPPHEQHTPASRHGHAPNEHASAQRRPQGMQRNAHDRAQHAKDMRCTARARGDSTTYDEPSRPGFGIAQQYYCEHMFRRPHGVGKRSNLVCVSLSVCSFAPAGVSAHS